MGDAGKLAAIVLAASLIHSPSALASLSYQVPPYQAQSAPQNKAGPCLVRLDFYNVRPVELIIPQDGKITQVLGIAAAVFLSTNHSDRWNQGFYTFHFADPYHEGIIPALDPEDKMIYTMIKNGKEGRSYLRGECDVVIDWFKRTNHLLGLQKW